MSTLTTKGLTWNLTGKANARADHALHARARSLAKRGVPAKEIAATLEVSYSAVTLWARREGYSLPRAKRSDAGKVRGPRAPDTGLRLIRCGECAKVSRRPLDAACPHCGVTA